MVALIETGTHALCDVVLRPFRGGEAPAARHLLRTVGPGMLLLWDRGFYGYEFIRRTLARGAAFLGRTKTKVVLPPAEDVLADGSYLSTIYPSPTGAASARGADRRARRGVRAGHPRWPWYRSATGCVTSLLDATGASRAQTLAADLPRALGGGDRPGRGRRCTSGPTPDPLRSQHPREVVQEVYGLLLAHLAIRTLMYQAAPRDGVDPDRLELHRGAAGAAPGHPPRPAHGAQTAPPFARRLLRELAAEWLPPAAPGSTPARSGAR